MKKKKTKIGNFKVRSFDSGTRSLPLKASLQHGWSMFNYTQPFSAIFSLFRIFAHIQNKTTGTIPTQRVLPYSLIQLVHTTSTYNQYIQVVHIIRRYNQFIKLVTSKYNQYMRLVHTTSIQYIQLEPRTFTGLVYTTGIYIQLVHTTSTYKQHIKFVGTTSS